MLEQGEIYSFKAFVDIFCQDQEPAWIAVMDPNLVEGWGCSVLTGIHCSGSQGGHEGPQGGRRVGSGGLPCASSARAGSSAAPCPGEEVTPALALSAVGTFRSLVLGLGDS